MENGGGGMVIKLLEEIDYKETIFAGTQQALSISSNKYFDEYHVNNSSACDRLEVRYDIFCTRKKATGFTDFNDMRGAQNLYAGWATV